MIPLHTLLSKLGSEFCQVLIKAHMLTGDDSLSKIGTKHAAVVFRPTRYLSHFGEDEVLNESALLLCESYLVRVWAGARSKTSASTFNELRVEIHRNKVVALEGLPPTSSAIRGHIKRGFYSVRNAITLLSVEKTQLDPVGCGWQNIDGILLPEKYLKPLPPTILFLCGCVGKCNTKRCTCKQAGVKCVIFCHKISNTNCLNTV